MLGWALRTAAFIVYYIALRPDRRGAWNKMLRRLVVRESENHEMLGMSFR